MALPVFDDNWFKQGAAEKVRRFMAAGTTLDELRSIASDAEIDWMLSNGFTPATKRIEQEVRDIEPYVEPYVEPYIEPYVEPYTPTVTTNTPTVTTNTPTSTANQGAISAALETIGNNTNTSTSGSAVMSTKTDFPVTVKGITYNWDTKGDAGDKADAYNNMLRSGATPAQIKTALENAYNSAFKPTTPVSIPDSDWNALTSLAASKATDNIVNNATDTTTGATTGATTGTTTGATTAGTTTTTTNKGLTSLVPFGNPAYTWNTEGTLGEKQAIVQKMKDDGFTVSQIRNEISRLEPDRSALTESNFKLLGLETVLPKPADTAATTTKSTLTYEGQAAQGPTASGAGLSALSTRKIYNIGNVQWDTGADLDTKKGYVSELAKTYTPDQIKAIIKYNDPANATDTAFRLLGLPTGDPTSAVPTGFRAPYQSPTELAESRGLGALITPAQSKALNLTTRTIDPTGMGGLQYRSAFGIELPESWADYSPAQKIAWYNTNQITPEQLRSVGVDQGAINYMLQNGYKPPTTQITQTQPVAPNTSTVTGISALAPPSLTYATPGFTAPSQGGLAFATQPGGIGRTQYLQNIASYLNKGVAPGTLAADMAQYGVTTDDLIAARAMFPGGAPDQLGAPISIKQSTEPAPANVPVEGGRAGGIITFAEGGPTYQANLNVKDEGKAADNYLEKILQFKYDSKPMEAYKFQDFGLTPATVELARKQGVFNTPRDVLFNPELKGLEAAAVARMTPEDKAAMYQSLLARQRRNFAEGGDVGRGLGSIAMKGYAQEMAQKGRFGDTMLAHISPEEAQMLQAAGGAGTINPQTGLPEYFSWKKLLKGVGKVLPFVLPFTGIGLGAQALISGLSGAVSGGKGFDFKRGLMSGLMSYGMGSLAQGAGQAGASVGADQAAQAAIGTEAGQTAVSNLDPVLRESMTASQVASQAGLTPAVTPTYGNIFTSDKGFLPQLGENIQAVGQGAMGAATGAPGAREAFTAGQGSVFGKTLTPTMAAGAAAVGMGGVKAADEMNAFEAQQAALTAKTQEEKQYYEDLFRRLMGGFAGGGEIAAMVAGGATGPANEPRTINGAGDGMSDSVPATIEGVQEARLADGEFVIPADVVADLGNGSSNAGSKKLYAMMDRVRKARHGTTEQPPEVDTGRLMPA